VADARIQEITTQYQLAVNDYVELFASQTSGGAQNVVSGGELLA